MASNQTHMNKEEGKKKHHGIIFFPDTIGPYTIKKTIGEGAFSIVKLAYHELYHQYYACKIVPIEMLEQRKLLERFELEIRISQIMRNPGVAAVTDVLKDENNFYVFMEYYPNGNLLKYIVKKRKIKESEARGLMYQILDAIQYIHRQGVCHRDLKPENIIIDNCGHIRISDFGLSQFVDKDNLVKTACGSPCYVSPEVISGKKYDGMKADIWSCGVVLYAMVTGLLPWTKNSIEKIFAQIRKGEYKIPRYVSQQCQNLISLLLTVDPEKRITLEEAKNHTWFNIKSEKDSINLLNFLIPKKYLPHGSSEKVNQIPYLSTRKVDIFFRPDVDYDFDYQFIDIDNVHAINNSINRNKCDVSSPDLEFDKAMKLLKLSTKKILKFRKRMSATRDRNIDLEAGSNIRIRSLSTGKLMASDSENEGTKLIKDKSENYITKNDVDMTKRKIHRKKSKSKYVKKHQKSAALPRQFERSIRH